MVMECDDYRLSLECGGHAAAPYRSIVERRRINGERRDVAADMQFRYDIRNVAIIAHVVGSMSPPPLRGGDDLCSKSDGSFRLFHTECLTWRSLVQTVRISRWDVEQVEFARSSQKRVECGDPWCKRFDQLTNAVPCNRAGAARKMHRFDCFPPLPVAHKNRPGRENCFLRLAART
jgi:hypothetical protein